MPVMSRSTAMGHNQPPSPIDYAREAMADLANFLTDNPVIQTPEQAKEGALFVERSRKTIQDLEDARKAETGPLNEQVKAINERYKRVRSPLDGVLGELRERLTNYTARLEATRIREAEEARKRAEALEMEARRAEEAEREAKQNATLGEITDVAAAIVEADRAFMAYSAAGRSADVLENQTHVRLPSQLGGKALGLRTKEELFVDDPIAALMAIIAVSAPHENILDAILTSSRAYRKRWGELPPGIRSETHRSI
jgi:multidrug efflux pump subunit AcrA (membrane-fusion protein)